MGQTMSQPNVVNHCQALLRIDSSNPGATEAQAAAYIVEHLQMAGGRTKILEPEPGRQSVFCRINGARGDLPALLVHGHLDVVPADPSKWTHPPFGGEIADGCLWGRGAIDMKDFVAMMLSVQVELLHSGRKPRRDVLFAYFADEEKGGVLGSQWAADNRPDLFQGVEEAVGELGGFTVFFRDHPVYPIAMAERGMVWIRIKIPGLAGHAGLGHSGPNPIIRLAPLLERIRGFVPAEDPPPAFRVMIEKLRALAGEPGADAEELLNEIPHFGRFAMEGGMTTIRPTVVSAGGSPNVVPGEAELVVDCRFPPGRQEQTVGALRGLLEEDMTIELMQAGQGSTAPTSGGLVAAIEEAIVAEDPGAVVMPYALPGGSDASRLRCLGIRGYGFSPLVLPPSFDYPGSYHAVDERAPVEGLIRGHRMLAHLIENY